MSTPASTTSLAMALAAALALPFGCTRDTERSQITAPLSTVQRRYVHTDLLGTVVAITDGPGNVLCSESQAPYGELANTGVDCSTLKYNGRALDESTGLYYYGARYYSPETGRFISADLARGSLADLQTQNRYSYVLNNPYKYIDPSGNEPQPWKIGPQPSALSLAWARAKHEVMENDGRLLGFAVVFINALTGDRFDQDRAKDALGLAMMLAPIPGPKGGRGGAFAFRGEGSAPAAVTKRGFGEWSSRTAHPDVARQFARDNAKDGVGYVYVFKNNEPSAEFNSLRQQVKSTPLNEVGPGGHEFEYLDLSRVDGSQVYGWRAVDGATGKYVGPFIKNPNHQ